MLSSLGFALVNDEGRRDEHSQMAITATILNVLTKLPRCRITMMSSIPVGIITSWRVMACVLKPLSSFNHQHRNEERVVHKPTLQFLG